MAEFAVRYTQPLLGAAHAAGYLVAVPGVSVLIRQDGVECDVFADNTKTPMDNPVPTGVPPGTAGVDTTGNLTIYLEPGRGYSAVATVGATSTTFAIPDISLDPEEPIPAASVEEAMLAFGVATQAELDAGLATREPSIPPGTYVDTTTAQTVAGAKRYSGLGVFDAAVRFKRHPQVDISHPDFGGDDSGATDNTAAWNALMLECVGNSDPASTTRRCVGVPTFGPGTFRFDSPIGVRSVIGLRVQGSGQENTRIKFYGTMAAGLDLNGVAKAIIEDFTIESDAAALVTEGIRLWWDNTPGSPTQASRSTTRNVFKNIDVVNCRSIVGMRLGADGFSNQVDNTALYNCHVAGAWVTGETSVYQAAIMVGHGVNGNNLIHNAYGCSFRFYRRNIHMRQSELGMVGGSLGYGESDIYFEGPAKSYFFVKGIRSESSERLLTFSGGTSSPANISIEDVLWSANALHADGRWVDMPHGGHLGLSDVRVQGQGATTPVVRASAAHPLTITADGVTAQVPFASAFDVGSATLLVRGYTEIDSSGARVAQTPVFPVPSGVTTVARKSADQAFTATGQVAITGLSLALAALETVDFEVTVYYDSTTANDLRLSVTVPGGGTAIDYGIAGLAFGVTTTTGVLAAAATNVAGTALDVGGVRAAGAAAVRSMAVLRGTVVNGATAGTLQVHAGKKANTDATSPADDATVYAGSHIRAVRH